MFRNLFHDRFGPFNKTYRCYPMSKLPGPNHRDDVINGGKIILPPSALEQLTRLNIDFPMLFKITNPASQISSHCGVLEFVADEGRCYLPDWMMLNLKCQGESSIQVETATLPVATFSMFEPQSQEFFEISNQKAMLENALRTFACLTIGDMIAIRYNNKTYELKVLETKPENAVSIIECDMEVDFSDKSQGSSSINEDSTKTGDAALKVDDEAFPAVLPTTTVPFHGHGIRLDGKKDENIHTKEEPTTSSGGQSPDEGKVRIIKPDYNWKEGTIEFYRGKLPLRTPNPNVNINTNTNAK